MSYSSIVSLLVVLVCLASKSCALIARVIEDPQPVNTSVNTNVTFTCVASGNTIWWRSNGEQLYNSQNVFIQPTVLLNEAGNIRKSILTLRVSSTENATNITCHTSSVDSLTVTFNDSRPGLLLVQGLLGQVSNIDVKPINTTCVLITWTPPTTLEGVPIDGYNVIISSTASAENQVFFANESLWYHSDCPDNVTIVPINKAGVGDAANYINNCPSPNDTDTTVNTSSTNTFSSVFSTSSPTLDGSSSPTLDSSSSPTLDGSNSPTNSTSIGIKFLIGIMSVVGFGSVTAVIVFVAVVLWWRCLKKKSDYNLVRQYMPAAVTYQAVNEDFCDGPSEKAKELGNTEPSSIEPGNTKEDEEDLAMDAEPESTDRKDSPPGTDSMIEAADKESFSHKIEVNTEGNGVENPEENLNETVAPPLQQCQSSPIQNGRPTDLDDFVGKEKLTEEVLDASSSESKGLLTGPSQNVRRFDFKPAFRKSHSMVAGHIKLYEYGILADEETSSTNGTSQVVSTSYSRKVPRDMPKIKKKREMESDCKTYSESAPAKVFIDPFTPKPVELENSPSEVIQSSSNKPKVGFSLSSTKKAEDGNEELPQEN